MTEYAIFGQPPHVQVKMVPVKVQGMRYEGRSALLSSIRPDDIVELKREPDNETDPNAIAVCWLDAKLGYAPRNLARIVAAAMDAYGKPVYGAVLEIAHEPVPYVTFNVLKPKE